MGFLVYLAVTEMKIRKQHPAVRKGTRQKTKNNQPKQTFTLFLNLPQLSSSTVIKTKVQ